MNIPRALTIGVAVGAAGLVATKIVAGMRGGDDAPAAPDTPATRWEPQGLTVRHAAEIFFDEPGMKLTRDGVALLSKLPNQERVVLHRADEHGPADRAGRSDGKVDFAEFESYIAARYDVDGDGCLSYEESGDHFAGNMWESDFPASVERWGPQNVFDDFSAALDLDGDETVTRKEGRAARETHGYPLSQETWERRH